MFYTARVNSHRLDRSAVSPLAITESQREGLAKPTKSPDHSKMTLSEAVREPVAIYAFVITYLILYRLSHSDKSLSAPEMGGTASAPPPATIQPIHSEFRAKANIQPMHSEFRGQDTTPFAPPLKDCQCQSCSDCRLYPGLNLIPNCSKK